MSSLRREGQLVTWWGNSRSQVLFERSRSVRCSRGRTVKSIFMEEMRSWVAGKSKSLLVLEKSDSR